MKTKKIALMLCVVLICGGTLLYAKSDSTEGRPRIGVMLDTKPLPDLLIKHLRLEPGQGIRISNVQKNSPADRAGLERDDIIIGFEGEQIKSNEQLIDAVQDAGVGAQVSLEIIHLGRRKTIKLQLEAFKDEHGLKYPSEPEIFQSWRPGRMFRFRPGDKDWMEMELPFDRKSLEVYEYHHSEDGESYSITIEGNPDDEDALITVRIGSEEYKTTIGEIDKLPEKYREVAEEALENSREYSSQRRKTITRKFSLPSMVKPDEFLEHFKDRKPFPIPRDLQSFGRDNRMFDKIREQMREFQERIEEQTRQLQERIEEMEKRFRETPGRPSRKSEKEQI